MLGRAAASTLLLDSAASTRPLNAKQLGALASNTIVMARLLLLPLAVVLGCTASAQTTPRRAVITLSSGIGAVGPGTDLGPGASLGVRRHLFTLDPDAVAAPLAFVLELGDSWSVAADAFGQVGFEHSDDRWLTGGGLLLRWDVAPADFAVRPYFIVVSVGGYVGDMNRPGGVDGGLGLGNGLGLEVPVGRGALSLEARAVSMLPGDAGGIPVTLGYTF